MNPKFALQIQYSSHQNPSKLFCGYQTDPNVCTIYGARQKMQNSQYNTEEEQS